MSTVLHLLIPQVSQTEANQIYQPINGVDGVVVGTPCSVDGRGEVIYYIGGMTLLDESAIQQVINVTIGFNGGYYFKCDFSPLDGALTLLETNVLAAQSLVNTTWTRDLTLEKVGLKIWAPDDGL